MTKKHKPKNPRSKNWGGPRPRTGPPPWPPELKRSRKISIVFTPGEFKRLATRASEQATPVGTLARELVMKGLNQ